MSTSGQLYYGAYNGAFTTINTAGSYNDGNWHHVVITQGASGTGASLYVDGILQSSNTSLVPTVNYTGYWRIGFDALNTSLYPTASSNPYFTGMLDDISVYNRVLTATEISSTNNIYQLTMPTAAVCAGSPITFGAPATVTGASYAWRDASGNIVGGQNPTFTSAVSGNYILTVTGGPGGCSSTATLTPNVVVLPSSTFTAPANIFATNTAAITYTGTDPATSTYAWTFTGGTPATGSGQGPFNITYATAGSYTATLLITNANGCTATTSKTITVNPAPTATNATACGTSTVTLTASGGLPAGGTYNWYNVSTGGTALQSSTSATYSATVTGNSTYYVSYTAGGYTSARSPVMVTFGAAVSSPISGAALSYPFNGNGTDISGNGNTAIISGATLTTDRFGTANSAYSFNGSSNYITTTTQYTNPTVFTISLWFNTTVAGGKLIGFGSSQAGLSGSYDRQLYMTSTGQLIFGLYNGATNTITTTGSYNDGNWHHAVITVGSDGSTLYVDGAVQASNPAYTTPQVITGYWRIGYDNENSWPNNTSNFYFTGKLDDIAIFSRELTAAEITSSNNLYQFSVPTAGTCAGSPITFGAQPITGATYTWQDAAGNTVTGQNPTFSSAVVGNYTCTVTGGPGGCTSVATITPNIIAAPSATFTATPSVAVNANATVTFTGTYAATSTYSWNFGGASPSTATGQGPFAVQWSTTGTKTITLTVTNASGCQATSTQTVTVTAAPAITSYGNYAFSRTVTLNTTSAGITSNLSNFPALLSIQLNDLIITGNCTDKVYNPNGPNYDFAFIDPSSATELYYQIESYNQTTGTLLVWVQVPGISYASNNTLTFYYGSQLPTVTHNTAFFQKTWTSDYKAVYHFNDAAYTGTTPDGTANAGIATLTGFQPTDFVTGKIGMAYNFGGTPATPTVNSMTATPANVTTAFTESAWVKLTIAGNDQKILTNQGPSGNASGGYKLGVYTSNIPETEGVNAGDRNSLPNPGTFATGTWYYVQGVYDGATMSTYVNGVQYKTLAVTGSNTYTNTLYIGIGEGGQYPFSGTIDEPRISNIAKTTDWLKMEYVDQNNPVAFTSVSSTYVTNVTNAASLPGALVYTWTGATSTDPTVATNWNNTTAGINNQAPSLTGPATLVINAGASNYPKLTGNASLYGLTIASGAALNLNGYTLSVGCHIYNSTGGQLLYGGNAASGITWNGSLPTQYYYGSTTAATGQTGNMTVNNSAAGTVNISTGNLDVYGTVTLASGNLVITSPSIFTLKSLPAQTAGVAAIPTGSSITGNVTAERYLDGGAGYRSYRLLSSPVNNATVNSNNVFSLNYIQTSMYLTGSAGGGFDKTGNPTLYLYREDLTPSNVTYTSGNFLGISAINNSPAYNYYVNGGGTPYNLPAGQGYLCFFRGNKAATTVAAETTVGYVPTPVTMSTTGPLNQGAVTIHGWYTPTAATLAYTMAGGNAAVRGFNMVGNPYASSIDWSKFSATNAAAAIYGPNVAPAIYEFDPLTKNYATYNAVTGITTGNGGKIIASGQGFFVQALTTSAALTFNEAAKSATQVTGSSLLLALRQNKNLNQSAEAYGSYMRLKLETDTVNYSDMVIGFNPNSKTSYNPMEDSKYMSAMGGSKQGVAAMSSDSVKTAAKWLPYPKNSSQVVKLSVTAAANGLYTFKRTDFKAIPDLYEVWLMDKYRKDSLDIKHNTNYAFDVNLADTNTYGDNRFSIVIRENPALALHLLSFTAAKLTSGAQVKWIVENEANYTNFTVERSTNGLTFTALGGYLSSSMGTYSYTDAQPAKPADYYRLKMDDVNGNTTYSQIVTLSYGNQAAIAGNISIYPNPSNGVINLAITGQTVPTNQPLQTTGSTTAAGSTGQQVYGIKIVSMTGAVLKQTTSSSPNWQSDVSGYMPGTYIIQVVNSKDNSMVGKGTFVKL